MSCLSVEKGNHMSHNSVAMHTDDNSPMHNFMMRVRLFTQASRSLAFCGHLQTSHLGAGVCAERRF